jgi:hypothetical protein
MHADAVDWFGDHAGAKGTAAFDEALGEASKLEVILGR